MIQLARYLKYFKKEVTIGPIFKFLEAMFELIVPLVMASIIDKGIKNQDKEYILQQGGIILLLGFVGLMFALICQYCAARASQGFGTKVRNDLYDHINRLSHEDLDQLGTNFLNTVITNDVNQMQVAVAMLIRLVVRSPFLVIGAIIMAMILDLKLSIIFIIVAPLVSMVLYYVMKRSIPFYRLRQKTLDRVSLITRENLSGVRVIRAFSKQEQEEMRFQEANDELAQIAIRVGKISAILNPAMFIILNLGIVAILWFGGIRVNTGRLTQGEVIAFANYMTQISLALVVVANLVITFTKAAASAARINRVLDWKPSVKEDQTTKQIDTLLERNSPLIEMKDVSFAYGNSKEMVLEGISLSINHGETIGIIGGTGAGKSTLIHLLLRFYERKEGEIKVQGEPIDQYTMEELRNLYGVVPQRAVLFSGTIEENMRMAKEDASMEEIMDALDISQSLEFVKQLEHGLETKIDQGGKNLSGGQRQRLTIARALVRKPKILILDDSSSALDYRTDAKLRLALKEKCKDMTVLMISQRANSIRHSDKIIVLDDGKIVGIGSHDYLYDSCDVYREICQSQLT